jgi:hypothetical protein
MKFTKTHVSVWHGIKPLPDEINTVQNQADLAEFELLSVISVLHGITAFDLVTGATEGSEKDGHLSEVLEAFQAYVKPKMPMSNYNGKDIRIKKAF